MYSKRHVLLGKRQACITGCHTVVYFQLYQHNERVSQNSMASQGKEGMERASSRAWKEQVPAESCVTKCSHSSVGLWHIHRVWGLFGSFVSFCYGIGAIILTNVPMETENRGGLLWERYRKK